jgi:hypothetical protein
LDAKLEAKQAKLDAKLEEKERLKKEKLDAKLEEKERLKKEKALLKTKKLTGGGYKKHKGTKRRI